QGYRLCQGATGVRPPDRAKPGRAVSDRTRLCADARGRADGARGGNALPGRARLRRGGQHGEAPRRRRLLGGSGQVRAAPRRLRRCRGIRHRAQVPRDAALSGGADLDQPDPVLSRGTRARPAAFVLTMAEPGSIHAVLLGDIGGTNSRFALPGRDGRPHQMLIVENDSVDSLDAAIARYLDDTGVHPRAAVLAVAGPIDGEEIALTNRPWRFRRSELAH